MEKTKQQKIAYEVNLANNACDMGLPLNDVVIVFAISENFVPYLSVAIQSLLENCSESRHYDIVILTRDIFPASMLTLKRQVEPYGVGIGFLDVDEAIGKRQLPHYGHFRPETYFRLLAPWLLEDVDKAIYLDSDLVVLSDVAELFDTDVEGELLAATRDADTIGQIEGYDEGVGPYLSGELGLSNPYHYFQAGVLLMNLREFRKRTSPEALLAIATQRTWRWLDQDVLNKVCDGNYVRLNMAWNCLYDWKTRRRNHIIAAAPQDFIDEYEEARRHIKIIHYAGPDDRPWLYPDGDLAEYFWDYARRSPYLGTLRYRLERSHKNPLELANRGRIALAYNIGLPLYDRVFKPGSLRRKLTVGAYMRLGGSI